MDEPTGPAAGDVIGDDAIERWTSHGLGCAITPGPMTINGYVRLPADSPLRLVADMHQIAERAHLDKGGAAPLPEAVHLGYGAFDHVDVHGGLTYGPDEHGWLGFDTSQAGDWWAPDDLIGVIPDEHFQAAMTVQATLSRVVAAMPNDHRRWTIERLHAEVDRLAEQLAEQLAALTEGLTRP